MSTQTHDEMNIEATATTTATARCGKFLVFELGAESYGLEIEAVREIIGIMDITPVPRTPESLEGVINLRGKIIPVVALRTTFGMDEMDDSARACIIVTEVDLEGEAVTIGLLVDEASDVVEIHAPAIQKPSFLAHQRDLEFIEGIVKTDKKVLFLLKLARILSETEQRAVWTAAHSGAEPAVRSDAAESASGETMSELA